MRISKEDFEAWWTYHPIGIEFRRMMKEDLDKTAYGGNTEAMARDHIGNAVRVGVAQILTHYLNIDYEIFGGKE